MTEAKNTYTKHNLTTGEVTEVPRKSRKEIAAIGAESKKIAARHMSVFEHTLHILEDALAKHKYVDVSKYTASAIGVSEATLRRAVTHLVETEKYLRFYLPVIQTGTNLRITRIVLVPTGTVYADLLQNLGDIYHIPSAPEVRQEQLERRERQKIAKSATYGLTGVALERAQKAIAKSEARADKGKRAWALKRQGYSNVAIGKTIGVSESTVRVLLKPYAEESKTIKVLMDAGQEALEDGREDILKYFTSIPEFQQVFGDGFGDAYVLRIHTVERTVEINPNKKRVSFRLEFWAQNEKQD